MIMEGIVLYCAQQLRQERSLNAIFHLITGKRSIQTVQDAHIFQLASFYGIDKKLTKREFSTIIQKIDNKGLAKSEQSGTLHVTENGVTFITRKSDILRFNDFSGMHYHLLSSLFEQRLLLLIQTMSNSLHHCYSFIPVIDEWKTQQWVKQVYKKVKGKEQVLLEQLYQSLNQLLGYLPEMDATIFVEHLSGYHTYGKSVHQLAMKFQLSARDVTLIWTRIIHFVLRMVGENPKNYPLLQLMMKTTKKQIPLITESAKQTYDLLNKQYTPEEMAQIRRLKINTIYDHLAEIALIDPHFPIQRFVTPEKQREITIGIKQSASTSLKIIKGKVRDEIAYFEIRLTLAFLQRHSIDKKQEKGGF